MWSTFVQWDIACFRHINELWTSPVLDQIMSAASSFALFKIPLAVAVVAVLIWGGFRGRVFLILIGLCLLIGDMGVTSTLKHLVKRPRPHESLENVRMVDRSGVKLSEPKPTLNGKSFSSGHTSNNVALALVGTAVFGATAWPLWPWAALVSYSRIYTGSHYPSDVLGSWIIALAYTWVILKTSDWVWRRWGGRWFPKLYAAHPKLIFTRVTHTSR